MQCTYVGNYAEEHRKIKKHRMVGVEIEKALSSIVDNGKSCEYYREIEACHLMKTGQSKLNIIFNQRWS